MGRSRYSFIQPDKPHFLTLTVLHWIPVFTRQNTVCILLDSLRWLVKDNFRLYAYVILENHLHLLAQSPQLDKDIARYKSYTAKQLINYLKQRKVSTILDQLAFYKKKHKADRALQFWQEGVHPELIIDEAMMVQKIDYIHQNPVKRGYVDLPVHWRYSSARNYAGQRNGLLDVITVW
ncbi:transposase [Endozoicomonas sp. SCSIO W0465]|uniref:REP-associated tyrosine transposase n=1 Tax=Endozoicomonas sp. SCSIO W0465 TaxID=2918516 RepID=UPI002075A5A2|nr:transposase [Endozoicomonas sp. SCSIO W0465]USE37433.1 transposase [Endozoicomonas sp. SCSIO W0465]